MIEATEKRDRTSVWGCESVKGVVVARPNLIDPSLVGAYFFLLKWYRCLGYWWRVNERGDFWALDFWSWTCKQEVFVSFIGVLSPLDIDECFERRSGCNQICENTAGSFVCKCRSGFKMLENQRTCIGRALFVARLRCIQLTLLSILKQRMHMFHQTTLWPWLFLLLWPRFRDTSRTRVRWPMRQAPCPCMYRGLKKRTELDYFSDHVSWKRPEPRLAQFLECYRFQAFMSRKKLKACSTWINVTKCPAKSMGF